VFFLYACWFLYAVYGHETQERPKTFGCVLVCNGCTHPVPEAKLTIERLVTTPSTSSLPETMSTPPAEGEIKLGILVGKRLASAAFTYEHDCCVDDYIPLLAWGNAMSMSVTIPMFRRAEPRSVIWALCLRYTQLIRWARYYKQAVSTAPLTPASLASFAGILLRSGLLSSYCT
jgi:hypothetical protein